MRTLTISIRTVGQAFGTYAVIRTGRRVIHSTRTYPYGMRGAAYQDAATWAREQSLTTRDDRTVRL